MTKLRIERVRCIDAHGAPFLDVGATYDVVNDDMRHWITIRGVRVAEIGMYRRSRFKPVVRVKAPSA